jgi:hypothetical protein
MSRQQRIDRFLIRAPLEHTFELATDPSRFHEFNPLVEVPPGSGRVDMVGNVYQQVFRLGPIRLSTRWETTEVDPPDLTDRPRPAPPWITVEAGDVPILGRCISISRYEPAPQGTLVTHRLEYRLPDGPVGTVIDMVVARPLLAVGLGVLIRRLRRWIESAGGRTEARR